MKNKCLYLLFVAISSCFLFPVRAADEALHAWTDVQGRTLQASFVKSDGVILTIKWNGQNVPIPLASLSPASQALAQKLSQAKANPSAPNPGQMHSWTDTQGRTLQATFIKVDATTGETVDTKKVGEGSIVPPIVSDETLFLLTAQGTLTAMK